MFITSVTYSVAGQFSMQHAYSHNAHCKNYIIQRQCFLYVRKGEDIVCETTRSQKNKNILNFKEIITKGKRALKEEANNLAETLLIEMYIYGGRVSFETFMFTAAGPVQSDELWFSKSFLSRFNYTTRPQKLAMPVIRITTRSSYFSHFVILFLSLSSFFSRQNHRHRSVLFSILSCYCCRCCCFLTSVLFVARSMQFFYNSLL